MRRTSPTGVGAVLGTCPACEGAEGCHNPFKNSENVSDENVMGCDDEDTYNLFDEREYDDEQITC